MATNVSEKDKTLQQVIDYCTHMLGYSGSMPSEVPNQSEE